MESKDFYTTQVGAEYIDEVIDEILNVIPINKELLNLTAVYMTLEKILMSDALFNGGSTFVNSEDEYNLIYDIINTIYTGLYWTGKGAKAFYEELVNDIKPIIDEYVKSVLSV